MPYNAQRPPPYLLRTPLSVIVVFILRPPLPTHPTSLHMILTPSAPKITWKLTIGRSSSATFGRPRSQLARPNVYILQISAASFLSHRTQFPGRQRVLGRAMQDALRNALPRTTNPMSSLGLSTASATRTRIHLPASTLQSRPSQGRTRMTTHTQRKIMAP